MVLAKYNAALEQLPAPGCGCHCSLLSVANLGVIAGIAPDKLFDDIRANVPDGSRKIFDREIQDTINKALSDNNAGTFTPKPHAKPIVQDGQAALRKIIEQSEIGDEADLWEDSPIRLLDEPAGDTILFLTTVFEPNNLLWIGDRYQEGVLGETIRTRNEWVTHYQNGGKTAQHIIVNPLNGRPGPGKSNPEKTTYRGDYNVAKFQHCLIEFDNLTHEEQLRFWSGIRLPVVCLVDSGGKSVHGWVDVQELVPTSNLTEWEQNIKTRLYDRILTPLGVDAACSNPARLSRLPGHFREEKGNYQKLLWLRRGTHESS